MIIVWDNGAHFSDHRIYFIHAPDEYAEAALKVLSKWPTDRGKVLATAPHFDWRSPPTCAPFVKWIVGPSAPIFADEPSEEWYAALAKIPRAAEELLASRSFWGTDTAQKRLIDIIGGKTS